MRPASRCMAAPSATFADRDLSLAGRVHAHARRFRDAVVRFADPAARLPNLAIHMNREVNESGLKFNKQNCELPLLWALQEGASRPMPASAS